MGWQSKQSALHALGKTKQEISINKLVTTVGHFLRDFDIDFANIFKAWQLVIIIIIIIIIIIPGVKLQV